MVLADALRPPDQQISASAYVRGVKAYQAFGRPALEGRVRCRFRPTCSTYSSLAVQRFGIARGLALTIRRVASCRRNVQWGTCDPVPEQIPPP
jgi:hypothetical protein